MAASDGSVYVIGVDGGTESLRAGVFDIKGALLGSCAVPYTTAFPQPGWAEQQPEDWWSALGQAVQGAVKAAAVDPASVATLCVDTTCCTVCALDNGGSPVRPALLWCDMRSAQEAARVAGTGDPALRVNSGGRGPVSAEWMVPKSLWLKEREPDSWNRAAKICEYQDFINLRLTGQYVASLNNVSVRWHYDIKRGWPESLLRSLGLESLLHRWPQRVLQPGEVVGHLTESAAQHLGLPLSVKVVQGGADAFIGMLGLGVTEPGQMALLTGSSHLQLGLSAHPVTGQGIFGSYDSALLPGLHVVEGGQTSTGSIVAWFRRTLCGSDVSYDTLDMEAGLVAPGCEGLYCLDHFQGNRTPHTDALSRGALTGLTLAHTRGHVFRALLEGVAKGTRLILDTMGRAGYRPESITIAGGATRSKLWLQIHADVAGVPFVVTSQPEAPMLGCAMLAAVAAGIHPDIRAAAQAMVLVTHTVHPRPEVHAEYEQHYHRYCALYPALAPIQCGRPLDSTLTLTQQPALGSPVEAVVTDSDRSTAEGDGQPQPTHNSTEAPYDPSQAHPGPSMTLATHYTDPSLSRQGTSQLSTSSSPRQLTGVISSSILAADFSRLAEEVTASVSSGALWVHVDMFDGSSLARGNFTLGPPVVKSLRAAVPHAFLDCHLGVEDPLKYLDYVIDAGASSITFHLEAPGLLSDATLEHLRCHHLLPSPSDSAMTHLPDLTPSRGQAAAALARYVRMRGVRVGLALCPSTPAEEAIDIAQEGAVDMVLVMSVEPGWGGQAFLPSVLPKIKQIREACPGLDVQVDGGVNAKTVHLVTEAGANVLVAGTAVYGRPTEGAVAPGDKYRAAVDVLAAALEAQGLSMRT